MKNTALVVLLVGLVGCSETPPQANAQTVKPGGATKAPDAEPRADLLSINLLAEEWDYKSSPRDWKVVAQPILSGADFVSFDTNSHCFTLTARAVERLGMTTPHPSEKLGMWDGHDMYFVLRALGEPIYVGVFYSRYASIMHVNMPVIHPLDGPWVKPGTNVTFEIDIKPHWPSWPRQADVRDDPRIIRAVQELFAHDKKDVTRTNGLSQ
jgi:hypothetical protein